MVALCDYLNKVKVFKGCDELVLVKASLQEDIVDNSVHHNFHRNQPKSLHSLYDLLEQAGVDVLAVATEISLSAKCVHAFLYVFDQDLFSLLCLELKVKG